ncbi:hypothetical protein E3E26_08415 [Thermococcus sp. LS1]|uniref:hypothetical protein n=1 Tax=Thermococcus sp. LS1 TaxID=1638259 RepID=UPI0014396BF9|nr:hypothetical protein [Thermococcus sp. LS1]NJD99803.1 hypothetical protein [Thermococcus sp. LS1]
MSPKKIVTSFFLLFLLFLQAFDFTMDVLDGFNISINLPPLLENLALFATLFLSFLLFQEFLVVEFNLNKPTTYTIIAIFFLSNINIMLKLMVSEKNLMTYKILLNAIPIFLIFIILPIVSYLHSKSVKKAIMLVIFSVVAVYPVSQLYPLVMDKFVALVATIYLAYSILTSMGKRGLNIKELLGKALDFDEIIIKYLLIKPSSRVNKFFFYVYALITFYMLSDFVLYILPSTTNLWENTEYLTYIGVPLSHVHLTPLLTFSLIAYVLLIIFPLISIIMDGKQRFLNYLGTISAIIFLAFPSVTLSPLIISNGYGVLMNIWTIHEKFGFYYIILVIGILAIFFVHFKRELSPKFYSNMIQLVSSAIMIPYLFVYSYSIATHMLTWYVHSPYFIFALLFFAFLLYSMLMIPYYIIKQLKDTSHDIRVQLMVFYIVISFLIHTPSVYSTLFFVLYTIFFLFSSSDLWIVFDKLTFTLYVLAILVFKEYLLYALLLLWVVYLGKYLRHKLLGANFDMITKSSLFRGAFLIGVFVILGNFIGEIIPFEKTLPGFILLFLFSGAEEILMKGIIYTKTPGFLDDKLLISTLFLLTHLLNPVILLTYLPVFFLYSFYLFMYQFLSIQLYDETNSIPYLMAIHFLVNLGILVI